MKRVTPDDDWPDSWKYSYPYDLEEVYGKISNPGYAYAYDNRRRQTLRLIGDAVPPGSRVLDIAAAQGNFTLALAELGYLVTWNDLREDLADYVRLKHESGSIEFAPGNAFELDFAEPFDAVLITEIIEHVAHPDEFLTKVAALVKPGGFVVMTTPNGEYFRNRLPKFSDCPDPSIFEDAQFKPNSDGHIFLLHQDEIYSLAAKSELDVEEVVLFTNSLTNGHVKTSYLLKIFPRACVDLIERMSSVLPFNLRRSMMVQMGVRFRRPTA